MRLASRRKYCLRWRISATTKEIWGWGQWTDCPLHSSAHSYFLLVISIGVNHWQRQTWSNREWRMNWGIYNHLSWCWTPMEKKECVCAFLCMCVYVSLRPVWFIMLRIMQVAISSGHVCLSFMVFIFIGECWSRAAKKRGLHREYTIRWVWGFLGFS